MGVYQLLTGTIRKSTSPLFLLAIPLDTTRTTRFDPRLQLGGPPELPATTQPNWPGSKFAGTLQTIKRRHRDTQCNGSLRPPEKERCDN